MLCLCVRLTSDGQEAWRGCFGAVPVRAADGQEAKRGRVGVVHRCLLLAETTMQGVRVLFNLLWAMRGLSC
jgi:hypothetical protein